MSLKILKIGNDSLGKKNLRHDPKAAVEALTSPPGTFLPYLVRGTAGVCGPPS